MATERKEADEPLCAFVYETDDPKHPRCNDMLSDHGLESRKKHGFVREAFTCHHVIDGERCGVQQMHWIHDPKYGRTHQFVPRNVLPAHERPRHERPPVVSG